MIKSKNNLIRHSPKNHSKLRNNLNLTTLLLCLLASFICIVSIATPNLSLVRDDKLSSQRKRIEDSVRLILKNENIVNPAYSPELVFSSVDESAKLPQQVATQQIDMSKANFAYVHPVMSPRKSSGFGNRIHPVRGYSSQHKGVDLAAPIGVSIRAVAKGRVIFADPYAGYGNLVVIDHGNGITTHYGHCNVLKIHPGDRVKAGQIIAEVGSTGVSTGPHLHLEVRKNGEAVNPENFFEGLFVAAAG